MGVASRTGAGKGGIMNIQPKLPLERIVRTVARTNRRFLITEGVLRCVIHEPREEKILRHRIEKILDRMGVYADE